MMYLTGCLKVNWIKINLKLVERTKTICGLAGAAGTLERSDLQVFKELLYLSSLRGMDSTGVAAVKFDAPQEVNLIKAVGNSVEFLDRQTVQDAIKDGCSLLMGHTRSRTIGDVTKKNAQPFEFDNVVGTHNGTLSYTAKGKLEGNTLLGTDSMALYSSMDIGGLDKVIENVEEKDAMALVWYEKADRKLHMYRNDKRPLYYAMNKKNRTIYWASESGMLYLCLNRNQIEFNKVHLLAECQHMTFIIPEKKDEAFTKPTARIKKLPKASVTTYSSGTRYFGRADDDVWNKKEQRFVKAKDHVIDGKHIYRENHTTGEWERVTGEDKELPLEQTRTTSGSSATQSHSNLPDMKYNHATMKMEVCDPESNVIRLPARAAAAPLARSNSKWRMNRMIPRGVKDGGDFYRSDTGRIYTKDKFEEKMFEGCANCSCCPGWGEPVKFLRDEDFLCATCISDTKIAYEANTLDSTSNVWVLLNQMV